MGESHARAAQRVQLMRMAQGSLQPSPRCLDHPPPGMLQLFAKTICVNRFYPKTQLSWLARLDHSHCNSADPLTDGLEVCCVFYRPGPGGAMCVVWWWKVLESRGRGGMHHRGVGGRGGAATAG